MRNCCLDCDKSAWEKGELHEGCDFTDKGEATVTGDGSCSKGCQELACDVFNELLKRTEV